jgi:hypothetical protein
MLTIKMYAMQLNSSSGDDTKGYEFSVCNRKATVSWSYAKWVLTFRRRIKSCLPFAGIIRRLSYSTRFQDKG